MFAVIPLLVLLLIIGGVMAVARHRPESRRAGASVEPARAGSAPEPAPARRRAEVSRDVLDVLDRAVGRGQLTPEVADAIVRAELAETEVAAPEPLEGRFVPATAEAIGYVGALLAMFGVGFLVAKPWKHFEQATRLGLLAGVAALFLVVGLLLKNEAQPVVWRMRNFVLLLSTCAFAGFTGLLAVDTFDWRGEGVTLTVGSAVAVYSAVLWQRRDRPAQQATTLVGALLAAGAAMAMVDGAAAVGMAVTGIGGAWALAGALGWLPPKFAAVPLGLAALLIGPSLTLESWHKQAPLIGVLISIVVIAAGSVRREFLITGPGVLAIMGYLPSAVNMWFGDTLKPAGVMLVSGALLLGVMLYLVLRRPHDDGSRRGGPHFHLPHPLGGARV